MLKVVVIFLFLNLLPNLHAQRDTNFVPSGFLDFNGYYDTRDYSVMTFNMLSNFEHGFQYFSLTNFQGESPGTDIESLFSEQNIRYRLGQSRFDATAQWVVRSGSTNDDLRFGIRWRFTQSNAIADFFKAINFRYSINIHVSNKRQGGAWSLLPQLEHVYRWNPFPDFLQNRIYIAGFGDQNFVYTNNRITKTNWVTEHQLGFRVLKRFYLVAEYRINEYLPTKKEQIGYGFGLEYKWNFNVK